MFFSFKHIIIQMLAMILVVSNVRCAETEEERYCKLDINRVFPYDCSVVDCIRYAFGCLTQASLKFGNTWPKQYAKEYYNHLYSYVLKGSVKSLPQFSNDVQEILENKYGTTVEELMISAYRNELSEKSSDVIDDFEEDYLVTLRYYLKAGATYTPRKFVRQRKEYLENFFGSTAEEAVHHAYFQELCLESDTTGFKKGYVTHILSSSTTQPEDQMINPNDFCRREYGAPQT